MKGLVLAAVLAFTSSAFAAKVAQDEGVTEGANNASVTVGSAIGGFTIGAEYERMVMKDYGVGAVVKNYSLNHNSAAYNNGADGVFIIGAQSSFHFVHNSWGDLALSPGFVIANIARVNQSGSELTAGPSIAISATHQLTNLIAVGLEWQQYYSWFDAAYNGLLREDISAKVRFTF